MRKFIVAALFASVPAFAHAGDLKTVVQEPTVAAPVTFEAPKAPKFALPQVHSVEAGVSTLGAGLKLKHEVREDLAVVGSLNRFAHNYKGIGGIKGAKVNANVDLLSYGVGVEYKPFANAKNWTLGAGALRNDNEVGIFAKSRGGSVSVGGQRFTSAELGSLRADATFKKIAPYLTVGYEREVAKGFSFGATLGALFQGSAKISTEVTGAAAGDARLIDAVERERADLQKDLNDFKVMPIIGLKATYRF